MRFRYLRLSRAEARSAVLCAALLGSGCQSYKIDIPQGNIITRDMVARLRVGMSRDQVRFVLGSPLLADIFHAERWDYVYRVTQGGDTSTDERLTVFFSGDKLARVAGTHAAALGTAPPDEDLERDGAGK